MIGCSKDDECATEWFHSECVGLSRVPVGEWYCDECFEDMLVERPVCHCGRETNLDEVITCASRKCSISTYHLCCVNLKENLTNQSPWYCPECE